MAELFCGATLRHLPHLHPLHQVYNFRLPSPYFIHPLSLQIIVLFFFLSMFWVFTFGQLLMPHVRTSLQINLQARASMLAAGGVFDKVKCQH